MEESRSEQAVCVAALLPSPKRALGSLTTFFLAMFFWASAGSAQTISFSEGFENGWGSWFAENGVWQLSAGDGHSGTNAMRTGTNAHPRYTDSRLISPTVTLPSASGSERVQWRFWQSYAYAEGQGEAQISVWSNGVWGAWTTLATPALGPYNGDNIASSAGWSFAQVDLTAFAGRQVRLGFYHSCEYRTATGWLIDEVRIWKRSRSPLLPPANGPRFRAPHALLNRFVNDCARFPGRPTSNRHATGASLMLSF